jgi:hypothetical protein
VIVEEAVAVMLFVGLLERLTDLVGVTVLEIVGVDVTLFEPVKLIVLVRVTLGALDFVGVLVADIDTLKLVVLIVRLLRELRIL